MVRITRFRKPNCREREREERDEREITDRGAGAAAEPVSRDADRLHFGGLRRLQHAASDVSGHRLRAKHALEDNFKHISNVAAEQMLPPIEGPHWVIAIAHDCRCATSRRRAACWYFYREARSSLWLRHARVLRSCRWPSPTCCRCCERWWSCLAIRDRAPQIEYAQGDGVP